MRIFNIDVTTDDKRTWLVEHAMSSHWLLQFQYLGNRGWKSFGLSANAVFLDNLLQGRLSFEWVHEWKDPESLQWMMTKYDIDLYMWTQTSPEPAANQRMLRCVGLTEGTPMLRMLRMLDDGPTRMQYVKRMFDLQNMMA